MYFLARSFCFFLVFSVLLNLFLLSGKNFFQYGKTIISYSNNYRTTLVFLISPFLFTLICAYVFRKIKVFTLGIYLFGGTIILFGGLSLVSFGNGSISLEPSPYFRAQKDDINQTREFLIAHAGGRIDSHWGTNSKEAVESALNRKYSLIELDFSVTKDQRIVASHTWEKFYEMTNSSKNERDIPTREEFLAKKLFSKYSTLSAEDVKEIMIKNPDFTLVTDKIRELKPLKEIFFFPDRTIVETFSPLGYLETKELGYKYPAYRVSSLTAIPVVYALHIPIITAPERMIRRYPEIFKNLHEQNVTIMVYTRDDVGFIEEYQGTHFSLLYTNSL